MKRKLDKVKCGDIYSTTQGCKVEVVEYNHSRDILVEFKDATKHRKVVQLKELRNGKIKNPYHPHVCGVGYIGVGGHPCTIYVDGKPKNSEAYEVWRGILRRCYDIEHQKTCASTYDGCYVNTVWLNFQNFAHWYYNNPYYKKGWHLDKDVIVRYNREYGPLRCAFIPQELNTATTTTKAKRGEYPLGVYFQKESGKFIAQIGKFGENQKALIRTDDPNGAWLVYKAAKEEYMYELGEKWEGKLDQRVIESLKNWTVEETD